MLCAHGRNGWAALTWRFNCLQFFKQHAKENNVKCVIFIPSCFPWFRRSALTPLWQDHNLSGSCCDAFLDLGGESGGEGVGLQLHWAVENKQERRLWNVCLPYAWLLNFASVLLDWITLFCKCKPCVCYHGDASSSLWCVNNVKSLSVFWWGSCCYVVSVKMGKKMLLKICLEIEKLKWLSNTGSGVKYGLHSYTTVHLSKCLFTMDRLLYPGFLVL